MTNALSFSEIPLFVRVRIRYRACKLFRLVAPSTLLSQGPCRKFKPFQWFGS